jgi:hypothetical protein
MKSAIFWDVTPCGLLGACILLVTCLVYSSTLKMEAVCSSETLVTFYQTTQRLIPEDSTLHNHCCETPISNTVHYHVHRIHLLDYIPSHLNAVHIFTPCQYCPPMRGCSLHLMDVFQLLPCIYLRSKTLWWWYISTNIMFLDIIHCPVFI